MLPHGGGEGFGVGGDCCGLEVGRAGNLFVRERGRQPEVLVMGPAMLRSLMAEAEMVGANWDQRPSTDLHFFGMRVKLANGLPDGICFVGDEE